MISKLVCFSVQFNSILKLEPEANPVNMVVSLWSTLAQKVEQRTILLVAGSNPAGRIVIFVEHILYVVNAEILWISFANLSI